MGDLYLLVINMLKLNKLTDQLTICVNI